ncbi:ABC transporter substrate-binding protein [Alkalihalobacillus pseudalcaliphilus]|uniref:ABC transporter substrate-binding protein n=1 Tax=Alkalihalobacillus pseudalcaliphilus TaxID=79884 RepID=UPI00064DA7CB|nr:extracellular solute-binding protein [Alkalihalobacillus pseudalcaliphilus]KMK77032.1 ABC transporter substrate-binding protein [Alkalihalobacillus pseudalcaliphilus]
MQMKRFGFLSCLLIFSLLMLAACGDSSDGDANGGNGGTASDVGTEEEVELRVVTMMAGTDPSGKAFEEVLADYQSENPHITIVNDSQSADAEMIRTKVQTEYSSGNEPDLMFFFNTNAATGIINEGKVMNLEDIEGLDLSGFNSMLEQQRNEDGGIYAAPQSGFYEAIFVNEKLFEEHGIELPTSWELYEKAIEEFSKTDIIPIAASTEASYYVVEHYILAAGGIDAYRASLADQHPAWAEGLDKIKEHAEMGAFPPDAATLDLSFAADLFKQEQAAMIFEGSWFWGQLTEAGIAEQVSVLPMPGYADGFEYGELVGGSSSGWFISTESYEDESKRDAVVDFFNYVTAEETLLRLVQPTGQPPAKGELTDLAEHIAGGHKLVADAPAIELPINDRIYEESFTHMRQSVPEIVNGSKTGAQVVEEAAALE